MSNTTVPILRYSIPPAPTNVLTLIKDLPLQRPLPALLVDEQGQKFLLLQAKRTLKIPLPGTSPLDPRSQTVIATLLQKVPTLKLQLVTSTLAQVGDAAEANPLLRSPTAQTLRHTAPNTGTAVPKPGSIIRAITRGALNQPLIIEVIYGSASTTAGLEQLQSSPLIPLPATASIVPGTPGPERTAPLTTATVLATVSRATAPSNSAEPVSNQVLPAALTKSGQSADTATTNPAVAWPQHRDIVNPGLAKLAQRTRALQQSTPDSVRQRLGTDHARALFSALSALANIDQQGNTAFVNARTALRSAAPRIQAAVELLVEAARSSSDSSLPRLESLLARILPHSAHSDTTTRTHETTLAQNVARLNTDLKTRVLQLLQAIPPALSYLLEPSTPLLVTRSTEIWQIIFQVKRFFEIQNQALPTVTQDTTLVQTQRWLEQVFKLGSQWLKLAETKQVVREHRALTGTTQSQVNYANIILGGNTVSASIDADVEAEDPAQSNSQRKVWKLKLHFELAPDRQLDVEASFASDELSIDFALDSFFQHQLDAHSQDTFESILKRMLNLPVSISTHPIDTSTPSPSDFHLEI